MLLITSYTSCLCITKKKENQQQNKEKKQESGKIKKLKIGFLCKGFSLASVFSGRSIWNNFRYSR